MKKMMTINEIKGILKEELNESRYVHTLGVMDTAVKLAQIHGCDTVQAQYAGLLHDCAKCISNDKKIEICRKYALEISKAEMNMPSLLHAKCGMILAKEKYGIKDPDILHAIRYHTTGCPDMNLLDKIIYIADYIEPGRDKAPHLKKLRNMALKDLDETLYLILKDTVSYLNKNKENADQATMDTYQFYKKQRGDKK